MGQNSEMLLNGVLCEMCGISLNCEACEKTGTPMYCSLRCAKDRGADKSQVCNH